MRIGIVTTWFERGAAYVSKGFRDALVDAGHEVLIFARGGENGGKPVPDWDADYVTWGRFFPYNGTQVDSAEFQSWIRTNGIDCILFNEQHDFEALLIADRLSIPTIGYVDFYTRETVPWFWLYDALICNTRRHLSVFSDHPGVHYVPWGTDTECFVPASDNGVRPDVTFFHSAGMGGTGLRKGTDLLVEAFGGVSGRVRLVIHSQVPVERYGAAAGRIESDPRIRFIEATVGRPGLYSLGDVYVYPARLDGIGLTVPEALSCGLPVITTDSQPMNEFVVDGEFGRLVPVQEVRNRSDNYYWPETVCSISELTAAMQQYADNAVLLKKHKLAAREYAVRYLSWKKNAESLGVVFENVAQRGSLKKNRILRHEAMNYSLWRRDGNVNPVQFTLSRITNRLLRLWRNARTAGALRGTLSW